MADTNRTQLELLFNTPDGSKVTFAILDPKDGITAAEANTVAQAIMTANIFSYSGQELTEYDSAQLRVLNVTALV